jgi:putative DNA methylase
MKTPVSPAPTTHSVTPFSLQHVPALIEKLLPVQRVSVESYKEQMANTGKALTALGSYWKGRKPLVLTRACVLGALLPATDNPKADLEIFHLLMAMDDTSLSKRAGLPKPKDIVAQLTINDVWQWFTTSPEEAREALPASAPFDLDDYAFENDKGKTVPIRLKWRDELTEDQKHALAVQLLPQQPYRNAASNVMRAEEIADSVHTHIWPRVNAHLGTNASNYPELVEQLGVMRFGHRPMVADTFSGSGQIPFEAARLGCDVYASDLNPVACMLTWGAFNIVGASPEKRLQIEAKQQALVKKVKAEIDKLGIETDGSEKGKGWRGKVYLYCLEVTCPETGWKVPVLPSMVVSKDKRVVSQLVPDAAQKSYKIKLTSNATNQQMKDAEIGSYQDGCVVHTVDGVEHRTKISTVRGDYSEVIEGVRVNKNRLRQWVATDVVYRDDDIFNERLYAVQWIKDDGSRRPESEFRSVTAEDETREAKVTRYVQEHLLDWQAKGWVPDLRIEMGFNTKQPIWERGWTHWHHLFNPRQLLINGLINQNASAADAIAVAQLANYNAKLSIWHSAKGQGFGSISQVFYNQALNTIYNYGCRGSVSAFERLARPIKSSMVHQGATIEIHNVAAKDISFNSDIFITDPPYGDAVKYEEIYEYFIAWLRKKKASEFSNWVWDSRRSMAIKGEDHDFKLNMVAAYKRMADSMPDNGLQIIMFTHQSESIWADMANIVWASGLQVTAAWYVATETDSALRDGQYVKGTILLVLRKRTQALDTARDELAYELADEVKNQVALLTGLSKDVKDLYRDENLFEDADLQMAGYAAALRVLTRYQTIDGNDMPSEALRPRIKGQKTMVDDLIEFAVDIANGYLLPEGMDARVWSDCTGIERFYLKMLDMEAKGLHVLSNYDNFGKAFKVRQRDEVMGEVRANKASLKSAAQLGQRGMNATDEFGPTVLRSVLYAVHLLQAGKVEPHDVMHQLRDLVPNFYRERDRMVAMADYLSQKTAQIRPEESSNARVLRDLIRQEGS